MINPPNTCCVTALGLRIVVFSLLKRHRFILAMSFVNFYPSFTVCERVIPDDYFLHVLS